VVDVASGLANRVGGSSSAGFRIPDDADLRHVLSRSGPLAVTSANEHGQPPCHSADEVRLTFLDSVELDGVVDGGERNGEVSTVVQLDAHSWRVLRHGAISEERISQILKGDDAAPH
jgi:tRNA A37 threonylcarbamoyladenosine synthetase subunit TsaC/SUA5/YrdC